MNQIKDPILLHTYTPAHYICKCTVANLLAAPIANWQHNRPPDMTRCASIAQHVLEKRLHPDWLIVISVSNNKLYVLDGIHRITALKLLLQKRAEPVNLLDVSIDITWLLQSHILLCIHENMSEGEEIDLFKQINSSMPVPDIYYRNDAQVKRQVIETVAQIWQQRYKTHFTHSAKPNMPNTNRDLFINILDGLYENHKDEIDGQSDILLRLCDDANKRIRMRVNAGITKIKSQSALDKCELTGCYLFVAKTIE